MTRKHVVHIGANTILLTYLCISGFIWVFSLEVLGFPENFSGNTIEEKIILNHDCVCLCQSVPSTCECFDVNYLLVGYSI